MENLYKGYYGLYKEVRIINLKNQNVKIWNGNATREFLDSRGLHNYCENDLGPIYGHQWRFWNSRYKI